MASSLSRESCIPLDPKGHGGDVFFGLTESAFSLPSFSANNFEVEVSVLDGLIRRA